ncbi:serine/threonine-protein kinase M1 [Aspergillus melleus]|uniref:Serine/threonine-protein kinase M1 n=1 Tax=Aspergillus melleus TaxID=138277 RepID=A0ACC3AUB2_9EURO|nr:serine/threonine-protein kinase M1 [Aspergillus melleus]
MKADDSKMYPTAGHCGRDSAEPVSSTLAAQLAPRLSSQGTQAHNLSRETFSQLRQELVGGEYNQLRLDDSITDVSKLICIVLKAGLAPSAQNEDPQGQVLDCLDIIQTIVEKAPQMLIVNPDFLFLGEKTSAPLYSWLVVRLLRLLCDWENESMSQRIGAIFSTLSFAQYRHTRVLLSHSVLGLLRACTTEILSCLESLDHYELQSHSAIQLTVPVAGGRLFVDLNSLGLSHAIFDRKLKLGSISNAINLLVHLLDCLIPDHSKNPLWKSKSTTGFVRHNLAWVLNGYQRLWSFSFRWLQSANLDGFEKQARICLQILSHIGSLHDCGAFSLLETQWAYGIIQILDEVLVVEHLSQLRILHPEAAIETFTKTLTSANILHDHSHPFVSKSCNADTFELARLTQCRESNRGQNYGVNQTSSRFLKPRLLKELNSQDSAQKLIQDCLALLECGKPGNLKELREVILSYKFQNSSNASCLVYWATYRVLWLVAYQKYLVLSQKPYISAVCVIMMLMSMISSQTGDVLRRMNYTKLWLTSSPGSRVLHFRG